MGRAWQTNYSSWDHKKSDMTEQLTHTHTHTHTQEKHLTESDIGNTIPSPRGNKGIGQYVPGGMSKVYAGTGHEDFGLWYGGGRDLNRGCEEE